MTKISVVCCVVLLAIASFGCTKVAESQPSLTPSQEVRAVNPKLVAANTRFGMNLFAEVLKQKQENVVISPSSVAIALSMTYNGATGDTKTAIANVLQVQGLTLEELNRANANLKTVLERGDPKVEVAIANSLWAKQGVKFSPDFIQQNQASYAAEVRTLDFADPSTPKAMNQWVSEKTRGKIPTIVDQMSPEQVMFLINAIYFKGQWTEKFDPKQTQERPFFLTNGSQKQHPLMRQQGKYRYAETEQFQAVSLPYGKGSWSLYVFLPKQKSNLSQFLKALSATNWETWMNQFAARKGMIQIPRFKLSYDVTLNQALSELGMAIAFDQSKADFSKLSSTRTNIDQVKHKTFIEVNEEGTEAAAATSVGITATSIEVENPPFEMVVNRPFFCAIRDNQSGEILFMGAISNPMSN
jgi:serine protease inhibitor